MRFRWNGNYGGQPQSPALQAIIPSKQTKRTIIGIDLFNTLSIALLFWVKLQSFGIKLKKPERILVAPLNWGLGHATRCIPIINGLLQNDFDVTLASDGRALQLLQKEFPKLSIVELPAYNISYPSGNMVFNIAWQIPKILSAIRQEKKFLNDFVKKEKIDLIISDNRYGCRTRFTKNIFISHQLNIITPFAPLQWLVNKINHFLINCFDECWAPDFEGEKSLAGNLSRNQHLKNVRYLGPLSRMKKYEVENKYGIIAILSGPEPQRTIFEQLVLQQLASVDKKCLVVLGKTDESKHYFLNKNIEVVSFMDSSRLNEAILSAGLVICRAGYSSIMDLVSLNKKAILIPTPGQTEQEYLAERLKTNALFCVRQQRNLDLMPAIREIENTGQEKIPYPPRPVGVDPIADIISSLRG